MKKETKVMKGTVCVLLYVRVPVRMKKVTEYAKDGGYETKYDCKLLTSKLKFDLTKQDVIDSFNDTPDTNDTFEEEEV